MQTKRTTGTFLITTELLQSYHFVAAAREAAEAPDRRLKTATLGHDAGPVRKLLKEQEDECALV